MATRKRKTKVKLYSGTEVTIYEGSKLQTALFELTEDMSFYKGVRLTQILEALYNQGKKDGANAAFEEVARGLATAQKAIPHRAPGRPRNKVRGR